MALPHPLLSQFFLSQHILFKVSPESSKVKKCAVRLKELRGAGGRGRDAHQIGVCK